MMESFFSESMRRNPFPFYEEHRNHIPVLYVEAQNVWMIFDYDRVKRVLEDCAAFSSVATSPGSTGEPLDWLIFKDPPRHAQLRALINRAFTPGVIASLEPRIRRISQQLLDANSERGEMDLALDYSTQLPLIVIAEMLGIPASDCPRFKRWSDAIVSLAETVMGSQESAAEAVRGFAAATGEMNDYLSETLQDRRESPQDRLLSRLASVEIEGQRLTHSQLLGFFQLLLLAGSETTTNLINNAVICLLEEPQQLSLLRKHRDLIPAAVEETLRYRSPLQAVFRRTTCSVDLNGKRIPAGSLVLPFIGSANRDSRQFKDAHCFDLKRHPNPHLAFGHGVHFCLGAALSRLEAKIALTDILARMRDIEFDGDKTWEPRAAFHVHGPTRLPIRFSASRPAPVL